MSSPASTEKPIHTGLSLDQEVALLSQLIITDQAPLAKHGYIPSPPSSEAAAEAAAAVEAAHHFEVCDRCSAKYQAFPERNEDGLLASGGKCRHHPNRKMFPQKTKADTGPKEPYYPCCNEVVGSNGCTEAEYHVFKTSSPARLHAVLPFVVTPERHASDSNDPAVSQPSGVQKVDAVAFDCEMGHTTLGLELIRVTAVSWPKGEQLIDCLVRPVGTVVDLNSRFSGVWPEHFASSELPIMDSPQKARELLCSYLTPQTPLIGHAIDNDLNAIRLCHPSIVDTVLAFPHPRGLPMRYGLRMLASKHLRRAIQTGGERGHDSLEDAVATGDLVRVKVGEKWKVLRAQGWTFVEGEDGRAVKLKAPAPS